MKINIVSTFLIVTTSALAGMLMGGLFGYAAGRIAPDFFELLLIKQTEDTLGTAIFLGSLGGLLCGGGLGVFAIVTQIAWTWLQSRNPDKNQA